MDDAAASFAATVAFEHRDFPLPKHIWARRAAIAARHFERVNGEVSVGWRRFAMRNLREITDTNQRVSGALRA
ncbi:MAG: hypothetical protein IPJ98_07040 [Bryobacterales bacterium]|nr:hypothetical protein [Bryobacterales bacterium]